MAQKATRKAPTAVQAPMAKKAKRKPPAAAQVRPRRDVAIVQIDPKFATLKQWSRIAGIGRTTTYKLIAEKRLHAIKVGSRLLVDVDQGLRLLRSLPAPDITLPKTMADNPPALGATRAVRQSEFVNA